MTSTARPDATSRWLRPFLLSAASGCTLVALWWVFVCTARGQLLDTLGYTGARIGSGLVSSHMDALLQKISVAGVAVAMVLVAVTALARRRWLLALEAATVVAGANLSTRVLKFHIFTRPHLVDWGWYNNSYPSGHTTAAASAMVAAVGSLVMVLFGWATLAAHWHRPSDVVGAYLVCFCWAFMALCVGAVRHRLLGRNRGELPDRRRPSRLLPALMVLAGLVALSVAAWCGWLSRDVLVIDAATRRQLFVAYLGSSAGLTGVAVAGMGVLLRQVDQHDAAAQQLA